jgi:hypothetical protein
MSRVFVTNSGLGTRDERRRNDAFDACKVEASSERPR